MKKGRIVGVIFTLLAFMLMPIQSISREVPCMVEQYGQCSGYIECDVCGHHYTPEHCVSVFDNNGTRDCIYPECPTIRETTCDKLEPEDPPPQGDPLPRGEDPPKDPPPLSERCLKCLETNECLVADSVQACEDCCNNHCPLATAGCTREQCAARCDVPPG